MRAPLTRAIGVTVAGLAGSALMAVPSSAAPANAPNLTVGTGSCSNGVTYSFVAQGNNGQGGSWSPAFLTARDGSHALFVPASFDFVFTAPDGSTFPEQTVKKSGPGPMSCDIVGHPVSFPDATLTGTVTGTIVAVGG
jgi:hypothetical protein